MVNSQESRANSSSILAIIGRKDLELTFQKNVGEGGRTAYKVLIRGRMKCRKRHTVHVLVGDSFSIQHDESKPL